jgi:hypothetical protein
MKELEIQFKPELDYPHAVKLKNGIKMRNQYIYVVNDLYHTKIIGKLIDSNKYHTIKYMENKFLLIINDVFFFNPHDKVYLLTDDERRLLLI